jgi:P4 family phage/plasmid primase-like protien
MTAYPASDAADKPPDVVTISRFRHKRDTEPRQERRPWDDLTGLLSRHTVRREKDGPLWSPVRFHPGAERAAANVEAVTVLVYDVDHVPLDWNLLDGIAFVAYTTYSHTADDPHWRIVIRLARPVPAAAWATVWRRGRARYAPMADPSCRDPCRMYYLPTCPPGQRPAAQIGEGAPVDAGGLPETPEEVQERELAAAGPAEPSTRPAGVWRERPGDRFARETSWAELLEPAGWRSGGERGGQEIWNRPGRTDARDARSANTTRDGNLWVWTSNAPPFAPNASYTKLHAHVLLAHGGDWRAAIRALGAKYGAPAAPEATNGHAPPPTVAAPGRQTAAPDGGGHRSDIGNALRYVARHGARVRYCPAQRTWLVWDGTRWRPDDVGAAVELAKDTAISIHAEAADPSLSKEERAVLSSWALRSESRSRIEAMLKLAESVPGVPVRPAALDAHRHLLNTPTGTIDLSTGELLPHDPARLLTKSTGVPYAPDLRWREAAPRWTAFLERVLPDVAVRRYVQKAAGYTLKGTGGERVVLIPYGKGRNGKSTLLEALRDILGDYAVSLPVDALLQQRHDHRPTNDIARTKGARFVWTRETEEGRRLNESLLKQLTGGADTVTARFLYQESFDFRPEFTLWCSTNHRPLVRGTDDGIWDRIRLVPFTERIPDADVDPDLPDRFRAEELPGILRWAVEGCLLWQREGLTAPAAVATATEDYRADMDVIGRFLEERCYQGPPFSAGSTELHKAYLSWCAEANEAALTQTAFSTKLADRAGITKKRSGAGVVFVGVGLRTAQHGGGP